MTDEALHRGLEGVTVAETRLSRIDGDAGELTIGGFPIEELAGEATFEEVVFLLWNDRLPTAAERSSFRESLAARRSIPEATQEVLRAAAAAGAPAMDALRMGVASASLDDTGATANREELDESADDARTLVARLPTIVATYWRCRVGEEPLEPRADLSHAANYLYMLTSEEPDDAAVRGLETYLTTVVDHGLNASTFTARAIVSTESDFVSAVTGAVGALKGPLHGGAPGPVLDILESIRESGDARASLESRLDAGDRLMGFGHRVYRTRDPRAAVLSTATERRHEGGTGNESGESGSDGDDRSLFAVASEVEEVGVDLLAERRPDLELHTNVEFYTAVLLHGVGVPQDVFSATFAVGRVGGWSAHCLEQLEDNRLIRPRSRYVGATDREWTPLAER